ncbi:MAG TPA: ABC transporter ATP-binding protein [Gemmatimonadales bacterium]|nr:ABC transporter ATP-binding protein [Gemmatimonadales bacterium]
MSTAIETTGLCYSASKDFAIRDLSLRVPAGALYGFLGPNGCGKTTTIRLLLGLLRPSVGSIRLLGHAVPGDLPPALARIGVVPDRPHLHRYLSVGEAIAFHSAFYPAWDSKWAAELLGEFRLPRSQRISGLSKGEAAKLTLLLALCQTPDLLVLDEPMDGLDPVVRRDVLSALLDYVSRRGATVFVSSHLVHELERFCDWIGVMDRGRMVVELPMAEFRNGNKRIRFTAIQPVEAAGAPFTLLSQDQEPGSGQTWVVRGWRPEMSAWFERPGLAVREVADLDLEDGFVELLRAFRAREG